MSVLLFDRFSSESSRGIKSNFPRFARRLLEQYRTKRAGRQSQQQYANEHEQQQRFSLCEDTLEGGSILPDCQSWYASDVGESYQVCIDEESKA